MTKQFAIAAGDHGVATSEKAHHGVPCRRGLPFIAGKLPGAKDHFGNLLLGRTGAFAVSGLQHPPRSRQLLASQSSVGWNDTAVERREKTGDRLDAVEAVEPERYQRGEWLVGSAIGWPDDMNALAIAEVMQVMRAILRDERVRCRQW